MGVIGTVAVRPKSKSLCWAPAAFQGLLLMRWARGRSTGALVLLGGVLLLVETVGSGAQRTFFTIRTLGERV